MIDDLIESNRIEVFLQPIVSIKDKKIFAYEALTRAKNVDGSLISPIYLFEKAAKECLSCKLDNHVRELALKKFQKYHSNDLDLLLFLNFESSVIDSGVDYDFISTVSKYNILPLNIVVEIKEERIKDTGALKNFITKYKKHGFMIAIDDFGTGYSSFDRLEFIKPDIVKIDRSIIYNIHNNFINSEILTAISNMCHKIGAMVLAEGVEHRDEIISCMRKDIDIFQGYWFCKPVEEVDGFLIESMRKSIDYVGQMYKSMIKKYIDKKQQLFKNSQELTQKVLSILKQNRIESINMIKEIAVEDEKLEAIYMISEENGLQVGKTIMDVEDKSLYHPSNDGHDHSLREYYFIAKESSRGDYLSSKYISKASGNMCRTYSAKVDIDNYKYIVCFDILD